MFVGLLKRPKREVEDPNRATRRTVILWKTLGDLLDKQITHTVIACPSFVHPSPPSWLAYLSVYG